MLFSFYVAAYSGIYPLSLHDALPILFGSLAPRGAILKRSAATPSLFETEARCMVFDGPADLAARVDDPARSEEHTSELQSRPHLVCRLLLEKKNNHDSGSRADHNARM